MKRDDIRILVDKFKENVNPTHRYSSFDYCYNYFRSTEDLEADIEKSCLVLGFYLASWGMFRGSSFILGKSVKHFEKIIVEVIAKQPRSVWEIDVHSYNNTSIDKIVEIYNQVKHCLIPEGKAHLTLTTKVLLGVFGFVPAYDQFFCNTFREVAETSNNKCRFSTFNKESLMFIKNFYLENKDDINKLTTETRTQSFINEQPIHNYTKAKIIDMYGFQKSYDKAKKITTKSPIVGTSTSSV